MSDKLYRDLLDEIAAEAAPERLDVRSAVAARLRARPAAPARRPLWAVRLALPALLLAFSAIAYAVYRNSTDAGRNYVYDANLGTALALSQTVDGATLTLDWAYADAGRLILEYHVEDPQHHFFTAEPTVEAGGVALPMLFGQAEGDDTINRGMFAFDTAPLVDAGAALDVSLDATLFSGQDNLRIGPYAFTFSVPFVAGQQIGEAQTATTGGTTVELRSAVVSPSATVATLCYNPPAGGADWIPDATLATSAGSFQSVGYQSLREMDEGLEGVTWMCVDILFAAPYNSQAETRTLTVAALETEPDLSDLDALAAAFAERGVIIKFDPPATGTGGGGGGGGAGFSYSIDSMPAGMTAEELTAIQEEVLDSLRSRQPGPWEFELRAPAAP